MKIPRLNLPRRTPGRKPPGAASKGVSRFLGSPLARLLLGVGVLLGGFFVGFLLAFPRTALLSRVEHEISRRSSVQVRIGEMGLSFPFGVEARKVRIALPGDEIPPVKIASLTVKPFLSSFFGGNRGAAFDAEMPPGEITGWATGDGQLEASARQVPIQIAKFGPSSLGFSAILQTGEVAGAYPPRDDGENSVEIRLDQAMLTGMEGLGAPNPTLSLGQVTLKVMGKGRTLRLEEFQSKGGEVELSGEGHIQIGDPFSSSRLNLNLTLVPRTGFPPELGELLELFVKPRPDGSFRLKLAGPVAQLSVH